jgi:hypothetical protein
LSRIIQMQNDFTVGEMDPKLLSRNDLKQYGSGLATALNVVVQPQGGVKRRDGSRYLYSLPASAANGVRLVSFEFSTADSYMLAFVDQRMYVFKDQALITNINGSGNDYLSVSSITSSIIGEMNWVQSADTLIVVHEDLAPTKIVRGASDSAWTASTIAFDYTPLYAFSPSTSNPAATLTPSGTTGNVTLTAGSAVFSASDEGQYINCTSTFGRARIVEYVSTTVVKAVTEVPFFDTTAIAANDWELESGYEEVWSVSRGYPRSVTFHEGRLYFGGSKSRPSTIWGSRVADYFNFDPGEALDDAGVEATLDTGTFNAINDIFSGRNLQVFTTGGEFYVPQALDEPITPSKLIVKQQTANGSKAGIRVTSVDGGTLFIQRQGKALAEFIYTDTQNAYTAAKISLLSSHLLKTPVDMTVRRSTSTDEGDRLLIVNGDDGSIACYTLLRSQNVVAPTEWVTAGEYKAVGVDIDTAYCVVKRTINGSDVYVVEYFDADTLLDSALAGGAAASVNVTHLQAATASIIRDGVIEPDQTVPGSPYTVTFASAATSSYQVGLNFTVSVVTLPVEPKLASGGVTGFKKRIFEVNAQLLDTQSLTIAGREIPFRRFGENNLDSAVPSYTGLKTLHSILGYGYTGQITIGQNVPLKMNLLGIDYKVSVAQ